MNPPDPVALLFVELGAAIVGLAILARIANRWGFSAIPLYLLAGLAFGNGGLAPLNLSEEFIHVGAEIGVLLLLFMLGLEYTGEQLKTNLRKGLPAGAADLLLNFPPGLIAGLLLGWTPLAAVLLGGITYISSSGVIAKLLTELKWLHHPEIPALLSVLVIEDLAMAVYLPVVAVLLSGLGTSSLAVSVVVALAVVLAVLWIAVGYGPQLSRVAAHQSDEIILLTTLGTVLLVAGIAQRLHVSAAIGAFLVGIAVSGPIAEQSHRVLAPMRDLFAAMFFFFFGLQINPASLPAALPAALTLGVITALTKILTGYWTAKRARISPSGRWRTGIALIARGEFSIVIAGLGTAQEPQLEPLAAAYVLFLAILGPVLARFSAPSDSQ
jgi:CPA2 family monovalent cation:H+ antiporter-2